MVAQDDVLVVGAAPRGCGLLPASSRSSAPTRRRRRIDGKAAKRVQPGVSNVFGTVALLVAAIAGVIGVGWLFLDAVGTEWDYCPGGSDCIPGWVMGAIFTGTAILAAVVGVSLLRR